MFNKIKDVYLVKITQYKQLSQNNKIYNIVQKSIKKNYTSLSCTFINYTKFF